MNICRWLGFRLELLGNFVVLAAAIFAVLARGSIQGGIVGLSISYALQVKSFSNECFLTVTALLLLIILIRLRKLFSILINVHMYIYLFFFFLNQCK